MQKMYVYIHHTYHIYIYIYIYTHICVYRCAFARASSIYSSVRIVHDTAKRRVFRVSVFFKGQTIILLLNVTNHHLHSIHISKQA